MGCSVLVTLLCVAIAVFSAATRIHSTSTSLKMSVEFFVDGTVNVIRSRFSPQITSSTRYRYILARTHAHHHIARQRRLQAFNFAERTQNPPKKKTTKRYHTSSLLFFYSNIFHQTKKASYFPRSWHWHICGDALFFLYFRGSKRILAMVWQRRCREFQRASWRCLLFCSRSPKFVAFSNYVSTVCVRTVRLAISSSRILRTHTRVPATKHMKTPIRSTVHGAHSAVKQSDQFYSFVVFEKCAGSMKFRMK